MMTETMPKCQRCKHSSIARGLSATKSQYFIWCSLHERNSKDYSSCDDFDGDYGADVPQHRQQLDNLRED